MKYFIWITIALSILPHMATVFLVLSYYDQNIPDHISILLQVAGVCWAVIGVFVSAWICEKYKLYWMIAGIMTLDRVAELDKLIPILKKEFTEKQRQYQEAVNERKKIIEEVIACHKVRFLNKKTATKRMKVLKSRGIEIGSVYHCQRCLGWHFTSQKWIKQYFFF